MAGLHDIVLDSARPAAAARFRAAALGGYAVAPYDAAEVARLRALGSSGPEDDHTVLADPEGNEFCLFPDR
ncbi:VOC family protein [Streptomyces sp. NPDC046915]|uniref:VOC family protein n=1 Tax=Streptomyces sp. NPDC046915 TaxID=3155257 RepID=UPI0033CC8C4F